jgi:ribonucleotide monophosphatase NagD (HAD superfamily)
VAGAQALHPHRSSAQLSRRGRLRSAALPLALVTNTTSHPRAAIAAALAGAGFPVSAADILTAPAIAVA